MIEIRTELVVWGVLVFDAITGALGMRPMRVRRAEECPSLGLATDECTLELHDVYPLPGLDVPPFGLVPYHDVMTHLDRIRQAVGSAAKTLEEWRQGQTANVMLAVAIRSQDHRLPMMTLSCELLRFAVELGADMDYDIYTNVEVKAG